MRLECSSKTKSEIHERPNVLSYVCGKGCNNVAALFQTEYVKISLYYFLYIS